METMELAKFSRIEQDEEFVSKIDGMRYDLKQFLSNFPAVFYKSGIWNRYERTMTKQAIEKTQKSPYGATITINFDDKWLDGDTDGRCNVYIMCPTESDML